MFNFLKYKTEDIEQKEMLQWRQPLCPLGVGVAAEVEALARGGA
jgi:hypothetical protein